MEIPQNLNLLRVRIVIWKGFLRIAQATEPREVSLRRLKTIFLQFSYRISALSHKSEFDLKGIMAPAFKRHGQQLLLYSILITEGLCVWQTVETRGERFDVLKSVDVWRR